MLLLVSSTVAAKPEKLWVTEFTYDVPDGTWDEGIHSFRYEFTWTYPEPGSFAFGPFMFEVYSNAPLYLKTAVLRHVYGVVRVDSPGGTHCEIIGESDDEGNQTVLPLIHPDQATRFHIAWPTEEVMEGLLPYPEVRDYFDSMTGTVTWDDGDPVVLVRHQIVPWQLEKKSFEPWWNNRLCLWTAR
jgi:hypothetical protein